MPPQPGRGEKLKSSFSPQPGRVRPASVWAPHPPDPRPASPSLSFLSSSSLSSLPRAVLHPPAPIPLVLARTCRRPSRRGRCRRGWRAPPPQRGRRRAPQADRRASQAGLRVGQRTPSMARRVRARRADQDARRAKGACGGSSRRRWRLLSPARSPVAAPELEKTLLARPRDLIAFLNFL
jgi:hypothetical protein